MFVVSSTRISKNPKPFSNYVALMCDLVDQEPTNYEEAIQKKEWEEAMTEEYQSIMKNDVWDIVPKPEGKSVVSSKWIYKIKHATDASIEKYKARFVARGFSQKEGIDYEETFAPVECKKKLAEEFEMKDLGLMHYFLGLKVW